MEVADINFEKNSSNVSKTSDKSYFDEELLEKNILIKKQDQNMKENKNHTVETEAAYSDKNKTITSEMQNSQILEPKKAPLVLNIGLKNLRPLFTKNNSDKLSKTVNKSLPQIPYQGTLKKCLLRQETKPSLDGTLLKQIDSPQICNNRMSQMMQDKIALQCAHEKSPKHGSISKLDLPGKVKDRISLYKMEERIQESKNLIGGEKTYILNQFNSGKKTFRTIAKRVIDNKEHLFTSDAITRLIGEQNYQIVLAAISNNNRDIKTRAIYALLTECASSNDVGTQTEQPSKIETPNILNAKHNNVFIRKVPLQRRRNKRRKTPYVVKDPPKNTPFSSVIKINGNKHGLNNTIDKIVQNAHEFNILDCNEDVPGCDNLIEQASMCSKISFSVTPSLLDGLNLKNLKPVLKKLTPSSPEPVFKQTLNVNTFGKKLQVNIATHQESCNPHYEDQNDKVLPKSQTQTIINVPKTMNYANIPQLEICHNRPAINDKKTTADFNPFPSGSQLDDSQQIIAEKKKNITSVSRNVSSNSQSFQNVIENMSNRDQTLPHNALNMVNASNKTGNSENTSMDSSNPVENALIMDNNAQVMWSSTINMKNFALNTNNAPSLQNDQSKLENMNDSHIAPSSSPNIFNDDPKATNCSKNTIHTTQKIQNDGQHIFQEDQCSNICFTPSEISGLDDPEFLEKLKSEDPLNLVTPELLNILSDKDKAKLVNLQMEMDWRLCVETIDERFLPIHMAVLQDNLPLLKRQCMALRARNESVDMGDFVQNLSALHIAVMRASNLECVKILLDHFANPLERDDDDKTVLHHCTKLESEEHLNYIVSYMSRNAAQMLERADLWNDNLKGMDPDELGRYLLNYANEMDDISGFTPIMEMSRLGLHAHILTLLGQMSPEQAEKAVNRTNRTSGNTALHLAVQAACASNENNKSIIPEEYERTIDVLLKFGADLSIENYSRISAISMIYENEFPPGMGELLNNKIKEYQMGENSLGLFRKHEIDNIINVLSESSSDENLPIMFPKVSNDSQSRVIAEKTTVSSDIVIEDYQENKFKVENKRIIVTRKTSGDAQTKEQGGVFKKDVRQFDRINMQIASLKTERPPSITMKKIDGVDALTAHENQTLKPTISEKNCYKNIKLTSAKNKSIHILSNIGIPINKNLQERNLSTPNIIRRKIQPVKSGYKSFDDIPVAISSNKSIKILSNIEIPETFMEKNNQVNILSSHLKKENSKSIMSENSINFNALSPNNKDILYKQMSKIEIPKTLIKKNSEADTLSLHTKTKQQKKSGMLNTIIGNAFELSRNSHAIRMSENPKISEIQKPKNLIKKKNEDDILPLHLRNDNSKLIISENITIGNVEKSLPNNKDIAISKKLIMSKTEILKTLIEERIKDNTLLSHSVKENSKSIILENRIIGNVDESLPNNKNIAITEKQNMSEIEIPKTLIEKRNKDDMKSSHCKKENSKFIFSENKGLDAISLSSDKYIEVPKTLISEKINEDISSSKSQKKKLNFIQETKEKVDHLLKLNSEQMTYNSTEATIDTSTHSFWNDEERSCKQISEKTKSVNIIDIVSTKNEILGENESVLDADVLKVKKFGSSTEKIPSCSTATSEISDNSDGEDESPLPTQTTKILPSEMIKEIYQTSLCDQKVYILNMATSKNMSPDIDAIEVERNDIAKLKIDKHKDEKVNLNVSNSFIDENATLKSASTYKNNFESLITGENIDRVDDLSFNIVKEKSRSRKLSQEKLEKYDVPTVNRINIDKHTEQVSQMYTLSCGEVKNVAKEKLPLSESSEINIEKVYKRNSFKKVSQMDPLPCNEVQHVAKGNSPSVKLSEESIRKVNEPNKFKQVSRMDPLPCNEVQNVAKEKLPLSESSEINIEKVYKRNSLKKISQMDPLPCNEVQHVAKGNSSSVKLSEESIRKVNEPNTFKQVSQMDPLPCNEVQNVAKEKLPLSESSEINIEKMYKRNSLKKVSQMDPLPCNEVQHVAKGNSPSVKLSEESMRKVNEPNTFKQVSQMDPLPCNEVQNVAKENLPLSESSEINIEKVYKRNSLKKVSQMDPLPCNEVQHVAKGNSPSVKLSEESIRKFNEPNTFKQVSQMDPLPCDEVQNVAKEKSPSAHFPKESMRKVYKRTSLKKVSQMDPLPCNEVQHVAKGNSPSVKLSEESIRKVNEPNTFKQVSQMDPLPCDEVQHFPEEKSPSAHFSKGSMRKVYKRTSLKKVSQMDPLPGNDVQHIAKGNSPSVKSSEESIRKVNEPNTFKQVSQMDSLPCDEDQHVAKEKSPSAHFSKESMRKVYKRTSSKKVSQMDPLPGNEVQHFAKGNSPSVKLSEESIREVNEPNTFKQVSQMNLLPCDEVQHVTKKKSPLARFSKESIRKVYKRNSFKQVPQMDPLPCDKVQHVAEEKLLSVKLSEESIKKVTERNTFKLVSQKDPLSCDEVQLKVDEVRPKCVDSSKKASGKIITTSENKNSKRSTNRVSKLFSEKIDEEHGSKRHEIDAAREKSLSAKQPIDKIGKACKQKCTEKRNSEETSTLIASKRRKSEVLSNEKNEITKRKYKVRTNIPNKNEFILISGSESDNSIESSDDDVHEPPSSYLPRRKISTPSKKQPDRTSTLIASKRRKSEVLSNEKNEITKRKYKVRINIPNKNEFILISGSESDNSIESSDDDVHEPPSSYFPRRKISTPSKKQPDRTSTLIASKRRKSEVLSNEKNEITKRKYKVRINIPNKNEFILISGSESDNSIESSDDDVHEPPSSYLPRRKISTPSKKQPDRTSTLIASKRRKSEVLSNEKNEITRRKNKVRINIPNKNEFIPISGSESDNSIESSDDDVYEPPSSYLPRRKISTPSKKQPNRTSTRTFFSKRIKKTPKRYSPTEQIVKKINRRRYTCIT